MKIENGMSGNRDKKLDFENTKRKLKNLHIPTKDNKNWLGYRSEACKKIDEMLLKGATIEELVREQKLLEKGRPKESTKDHIRHLEGETEEDHGLPISIIGGVYKFNNLITKKENFEEIEQEKKNIEKKYNKQIEKIKETEKEAIVSQRVGQDSLRKLLLQLYKNKCAMCNIDAVDVLRASHIVPWIEDEGIRLDPTNAILLCGLHDLAFDKRLITINNNFSIFLPNKPDGLQNVLNKFTYDKLDLPTSNEYHPKTEYLQSHKDISFEKKVKNTAN